MVPIAHEQNITCSKTRLDSTTLEQTIICRQLFAGHVVIGGLSANGKEDKNESNDNKQLLDEVFVISGIIKVEVSVISRSRSLRLITLTETLIIPDITKTESNNCFIIHCFEENNDICIT